MKDPERRVIPSYQSTNTMPHPVLAGNGLRRWSDGRRRNDTSTTRRNRNSQGSRAPQWPRKSPSDKFGAFLSVREMHPSFIQQDFTLCLCSSICNLLYMLRAYTRDSLHLSINWSHELTVRGGLFAENGAPILRKKICLVWVVAKVASNGPLVLKNCLVCCGFCAFSFFFHALVVWDAGFLRTTSINHQLFA